MVHLSWRLLIIRECWYTSSSIVCSWYHTTIHPPIHPCTNSCTDSCTAQLTHCPRLQSCPSGTIHISYTLYCCSLYWNTEWIDWMQIKGLFECKKYIKIVRLFVWLRIEWCTAHQSTSTTILTVSLDPITILKAFY